MGRKFNFFNQKLFSTIFLLLFVIVVVHSQFHRPRNSPFRPPNGHSGRRRPVGGPSLMSAKSSAPRRVWRNGPILPNNRLPDISHFPLTEGPRSRPRVSPLPKLYRRMDGGHHRVGHNGKKRRMSHKRRPAAPNDHFGWRQNSYFPPSPPANSVNSVSINEKNQYGGDNEDNFMLPPPLQSENYFNSPSLTMTDTSSSLLADSKNYSNRNQPNPTSSSSSTNNNQQKQFNNEHKNYGNTSVKRKNYGSKNQANNYHKKIQKNSYQSYAFGDDRREKNGQNSTATLEEDWRQFVTWYVQNSGNGKMAIFLPTGNDQENTSPARKNQEEPPNFKNPIEEPADYIDDRTGEWSYPLLEQVSSIIEPQ